MLASITRPILLKQISAASEGSREKKLPKIMAGGWDMVEELPESGIVDAADGTRRSQSVQEGDDFQRESEYGNCFRI